MIVSPLFLLIVASLKPDRFQILAEMGSFKAFWVTNPTLKNYADILSLSGNQPFARYLLNSVVVLAFTLVGGMLFNSMAAFVLAWGRLPGRAIVLTLMIGLYIVPQESIVLPLLSIVNGIGLAELVFRADPAVPGQPALRLPALPILQAGAARHL